MKWIGQHIYDLIARFRDDVYLEDISDGTAVDSKFLGLDSNGKVIKETVSVSVTDLHSAGVDGSNNQLLTDDGDGTITSEANLTFNGSSLNINGAAEIASDGHLYFRDQYSFIQSPSANDLLIAAAADCEIASDTIVLDAGASIELDAVSSMTLKLGDTEFLDFKNVNNTFARFYAESGNNTAFTIYEQGGDSLNDYCSIVVEEHGATTLYTIDNAAAAAHFKITADGNITLDAAGDIALEAAGGDVTGDADNYTFTSSSSGKPLLTLKTTNTTKEASGELRFQKDANNTEDGEFIGQISFYGENNAGTPETLQYGRVIGYMADQIDGQEAGGLQISVAAYDGVLTSGLLLNGNTNVDDQVDVTIGSGSGSKTAIAGTIELGHASDTTLARSASGVVTIEGNQVVTAGATNVASGSQEPIGMQVVRRTLTTAECSALHTTPITILAAPGANKVIIPTHCTIFVDRALTNTGTGDIIFGYDSPASFQNAIFYSRRFHNNVTTDMHYEVGRYTGKWGTSLTAGVNTVFDVYMSSALTTNCMTSMDVYVTYYVIDIS